MIANRWVLEPLLMFLPIGFVPMIAAIAAAYFTVFRAFGPTVAILVFLPLAGLVAALVAKEIARRPSRIGRA